MISHPSFSTFVAQLREFVRRHSASDGCLGSGYRPDENEFNQLALALFALQFAHNAPYRQFCQSRRSTPETVRNWPQIPAMPAAAFKDLELTSLPTEQSTRVFHSSGTTGQQPSRHFHDTESLALYEASLLPWFRAHLLPASPAPGELICVFLTPPSADAPHSSLAHMFETIRRQLAFRESVFAGQIGADGGWSLDVDICLGTLRKAVDMNRPALLLGTAFSFVHLLDHLEQSNFRLHLPAGSRVMETGGYKGRSRSLPKPELHSLISHWLAVPSTHIVSEYGMSELSSQAYDTAVGDLQGTARAFRFPPWARAQIISPETAQEVAEGETGLIRIFDLANVRSVLAIQTEDLGIRHGDGFELLGRAALAEPRGCSLMTH